VKHPHAHKMVRHHPEVQDRQMMVDGFQDFAFKAFHPKYEKSAAPLSKRRNGIGPVKNGDGVFFGNAHCCGYEGPYVERSGLGMAIEPIVANRFAITGLALLGSIAYASAISSNIKSTGKSTFKAARQVSSLTAIRYAFTGYVGYHLIQDLSQ
jgi:hypothetical protein